MEKVKSKITESSKNLANNVEFFVVEKPKTPEDNPIYLTYKADPISFALQVQGGFMPQDVHGFYLEEEEALSVAHDLVTAVFEQATALEEKKAKVSDKLQKVIDKLQKEVNKYLKLAKNDPNQSETHHAKAEQLMSKIKTLRSKHKLVEKSKKTILDKKAVKV